MKNLIKAKEYTQIAESDYRYATFLFIALRYLEVPFTVAITELQDSILLQENSIDYRHLFTIDDKSVLGIFTAEIRSKEAKIKEFIAKQKLEPADNTQNFIVIEALLNATRGPKQFMQFVIQKTEEARLCHSKLTDKTIEDYIG